MRARQDVGLQICWALGKFKTKYLGSIWVVVKIMVPFWFPIIIRHLIFRVPKKGIIILTTTHISEKAGLSEMSMAKRRDTTPSASPFR